MAITGKVINNINTINSHISKKKNITKSEIIKRVLKTIPIKTENITSPSRYSFFQGLKNVLSIKGSEKR